MAVVESGFCQKDSRAPQMEIFGTKGTITFVNNGSMNPLKSLEVYLDAPERGIRGWMKPMEMLWHAGRGWGNRIILTGHSWRCWKRRLIRKKRQWK